MNNTLRTVVRTGFHPEIQRVYSGENIFKVIDERWSELDQPHQGLHFLQVENNVWLKEIAPDCFVTDWTNQERWARVVLEEVNPNGKVISSWELGFIIITVDREKGLF